MPTLKIRLDNETLDRLVEAAIRELRPVDLQALVILRRSLALPVPYPPDPKAGEPTSENRHGNGA